MGGAEYALEVGQGFSRQAEGGSELLLGFVGVGEEFVRVRGVGVVFAVEVFVVGDGLLVQFDCRGQLTGFLIRVCQRAARCQGVQMFFSEDSSVIGQILLGQ
nr:hypothetical protein [Nocardia takedensis]